MNKYIALLRGINVGGHHKIPMSDLKENMKGWGFEDIVTILNSGNIIFESSSEEAEVLEIIISENLEKEYGFPVPTIVKKAGALMKLHSEAPFENIPLTKDIMLYVSFLKEKIESQIQLPWTSPDNSFVIIKEMEGMVLSVLDLSISNTPNAMEALEKFFGKNITTRNWNTIERIVKKL